MDIRRATDMLSRTYASLSLSTKTTTIPSSSRIVITRPSINSSWKCQSCRRQLSTQPARLQESSPSPPRKPTPQPEYNHDMYKKRDSDFLPSRNTTPRAFGDQRPSRTRVLSSQRDADRTSLDDLIESQTKASRNDGVSSTWGQPATATRTLAPLDGSRFSSSALAFPDSAERTSHLTPRPRILTELDIHVKPRTGRSVPVDPFKTNDLGAKLRVLEGMCMRNKVKRDFQMQRFHERPGLKRKRLARERWRLYFGKKFKGTVARVNNLRVQGW